MNDDYPNKFRFHVQKFSLPLTLLSVALILLGIAGIFSDEPELFVVFAIPGVLLYMLIHLTKPKESNRQASGFTARAAGLGGSNTKESSTEVEAITSVADELLKWHELKDKNIITEAQFKKKRDELLNSER